MGLHTFKLSSGIYKSIMWLEQFNIVQLQNKNSREDGMWNCPVLSRQVLSKEMG